jgi:hypothetical protein
MQGVSSSVRDAFDEARAVSGEASGLATEAGHSGMLADVHPPPFRGRFVHFI